MSVTKVSRILVSQPQPAIPEKSPFFELARRQRITVDYHPFIRVAGVSLKEFRQQRVEILDHTAVIFTSRTTVDSFFRICEEARITVPETMKYICQTEAVALYLQKYIVYRKRKISFADGSFTNLIELLIKHKEEKFLLTLSEPHKPDLPETMAKLKFSFHPVILARTVAADPEGIDIRSYDVVGIYSPSEVKVLIEQFGDELPTIAAFGEATAFYNDLYRAGLLGDDFGCSADYCGPIAMAVLGGESKDPDAVCARVSETVAQIARDGFDGPAFERARRAVYGGWLRGLDRFDDVCIAMAEGLFGGYEHMDAFPLLGEITAAECAKWLTETLAPERLALSVVAPKGGEDDADDDA